MKKRNNFKKKKRKTIVGRQNVEAKYNSLSARKAERVLSNPPT
jgi:hypothetical protein